MQAYKVVEKSGLRWYVPLDTKVYNPSVSTVIHWRKTLALPPSKRKAGNGANIGTAVHSQISKCIYDDFGVGEYEEVCKMPNIEIWNIPKQEINRRVNNSMKMFYAFIKDHPDFEPLGTEEVFFFNKGGNYFAGRLDLRARFDDKTYLIDFKTGNYYPDYNIQVCGGYGGLAAANGHRIDEIALLMLDANLNRNPNQTYKFKVFTPGEREAGVLDFIVKLEDYHASHVKEMVFKEGEYGY